MKLHTEEMVIERMMRWAKNDELVAFDTAHKCPDGVFRTVAEMKKELRHREEKGNLPGTVGELRMMLGAFLCDRLECDQCQKPVKQLVEAGEPMDDESRTARLCRDCVVAALGMFK